MVRIISDTSTLYSPSQAKDAGFDVVPLTVTINDRSYREFEDISAEEFVALIRQGHIPTSSQPSIGDVVQLYEQYPEDDILNISMAAGLSGTYDSAATAAKLCGNASRVTVLNSRTLCGPHRYLVEQAVAWARDGAEVATIVSKLEALMETEKSFLLPCDFDYLRRGGRLSHLVSYIGVAASLIPVMTPTEDHRRLTIASVRRGFSHAVKYVGSHLAKRGAGQKQQVYISHADAPDKAQQAQDLLAQLLPDAVFHIVPLSPAFITQGGPGCVAIQAIACG